jgi:hypothetical protein
MICVTSVIRLIISRRDSQISLAGTKQPDGRIGEPKNVGLSERFLGENSRSVSDGAPT